MGKKSSPDEYVQPKRTVQFDDILAFPKLLEKFEQHRIGGKLFSRFDLFLQSIHAIKIMENGDVHCTDPVAYTWFGEVNAQWEGYSYREAVKSGEIKKLVIPKFNYQPRKMPPHEPSDV